MSISSVNGSSASNISSMTTNFFKKADANGDGSPPGGGGGAPPAKAGGSGGSGSSDNKVYDPADTNKDGVVSSQEQAVYDAKHSGNETNSTSKYSQQGTKYSSNSITSSMIDLTA